MSGLFLTADLVISSKVAGGLATSHEALETVSSIELLVERAAQEPVKLVLLDLSFPKLDPLDLVPRLRGLDTPPGAIVAFGPHVHRAKLQAAQEAGCEEVFSRGQFHRLANEILAKYFV